MTIADAPTTWNNTEPTTTLQVLLLFGGVPLLIIALITLAVVVPSLAKGPGYRPGQDFDAKPEWLGAAPLGQSTAAGHELGAGTAPREQATDPSDDRLGDDNSTGGASVKW